MPKSDKELADEMRAGLSLQHDVITAFLKAYPEYDGRVKVDVTFGGEWTGWHFDAGLCRARLAAPSNPDDMTD